MSLPGGPDEVSGQTQQLEHSKYNHDHNFDVCQWILELVPMSTAD